MTSMPLRLRSFRWSWFTLLLCATGVVHSQTAVIRDGTVGADASLQPQLNNGELTVDESMGLRPGDGVNLLHSFSEFGIAAGDTVRFTADPTATTLRIISRVTGSGASLIDGTLQSNVSGADLYLLNPMGIVIGESGSVDVSGSFHASTAQSLVLLEDDPEGALTFTNNTQLAFAEPSAFGFISPDSTLQVQGAELSLADGVLVLSAGALSIRNADLAAQGLTVSGETIDIRGSKLQSIDGGELRVQAQRELGIRSSEVRTTTAGNRSAGDIALIGGDRLSITGGTVDSSTTGRGAAGNVALTANSIELTESAQIQSVSGEVTFGGGGGGGGNGGGNDANGGGNGGGGGTGGGGNGGSGGGGNNGSGGSGGGNGGGNAITVGPGGNVTISADQRILARLNVNIGANSNADGDAGVVELSAPIVELLDGSRLSSSAAAAGNGGVVRVNASERLTLEGTNNPDNPNRDRGSRITASSAFAASGDAGVIEIATGRLELFDGARVSSSTSGVGAGGDIRIRADEAVVLRGARGDGSGSSVRAVAEVEEEEVDLNSAPRTASAGTIDISSPQLTLLPGTEIRSSTALPGDGGPVRLDVSRLELNDATIASNSIAVGSGNAGNVRIGFGDRDLALLQLTNSVIETSAEDAGGGDIDIQGSGSLRLLENSGIDASDTGGEGGNVRVAMTRDILVLDQSKLLARAAVSGGDGGIIEVSTDAFLRSEQSEVDAANDVIINSPETEVEGDIVALPVAYQDPGRLFAASCAARTESSSQGSLVVTGKTTTNLTASRLLFAQFDHHSNLAEALHRGAYQQVLQILAQQATASDPIAARVTHLNMRSIAHAALNQRAAADRDLDAAFKLDPNAAQTHLHRGNLALLEGDLTAADEHFSLAGWPASALANRARSAAMRGEFDNARELLTRAGSVSVAQTDRGALARHLAQTHLLLLTERAVSAELLATRSLLLDALALARTADNAQDVAETEVLLAALYRLDDQPETAQRLMNHALLRFTEPPLAALLLAAQLHSERSGVASAQSAWLRLAERLFEQPMFGQGYSLESQAQQRGRAFRLMIANLLQPRELAQPQLLTVRNLVESYRQYELQDYFQDDCVAALEATAVSLDSVAPQTAVVYPLILDDRLELVVSINGALSKHRVAVERVALEQLIERYRQTLQERITNRYLAPAQELHQLLIEPIQERLASERVHTLVFVPDGSLLTVPLAALHDGQAHLIERFAVAITPGMSLYAPTEFGNVDPNVLLAGSSGSAVVTPALPFVDEELEQIQGLYNGALLVNEQFDRETFTREITDRQPNVVHIASHAYFDETPERSFLATHTDKLGFDDLRAAIGTSKFRRPLELLTLSACETAAGSSKAALGLAGVAIRAGARSAVGTLWRVSDQASSELIVAFYRELKNADAGRAEALAQAQRTMVADQQFGHPYYWSGFLMINNWL